MLRVSYRIDSGTAMPRLQTWQHRLSRLQRIYFLSVLLVLLPLTFIACAVKLIGDYDATIDSGVTEVQQKAETYFARLQSDPETKYDQSFYEDIHVRLAVLKSRASSLPKYPIILEQLNALQHQFDTFEQLDKSSKRPLPTAAVNDAESAIAVSVESILKLELALKSRGQPAPPSLAKAK